MEWQNCRFWASYDSGQWSHYYLALIYQSYDSCLLSLVSGHVPYRDSKLTRILQPALGGNAKTAVICNVTPALVSHPSFIRYVANIFSRIEILSWALFCEQYFLVCRYMQMKLRGHSILQVGPTVSPTVHKWMRWGASLLAWWWYRRLMGLDALRIELECKRCHWACVMQIMTDAALLKRQKKEIEELRAKLQVRFWIALTSDLGMRWSLRQKLVAAWRTILLISDQLCFLRTSWHHKWVFLLLLEMWQKLRTQKFV
jgi:hypothetical protein